MNINKKLILLLIGTIFISGCIGQPSVSDKDKAISECKQECNNNLKTNVDLNNGPCLLNPISDLPDWVCDVAHEPRQTVDDDSKNQCSVFRNGQAHHFIEVDPNCSLIKTW